MTHHHHVHLNCTELLVAEVTLSVGAWDPWANNEDANRIGAKVTQHLSDVLIPLW